MPKKRLDVLLVERGLAESRTQAQRLVMAGCVHSSNARLDKPGGQVADDIALFVKGKEHPWVSRGGLKLVHGLVHFGIDPTGMTCLDVGASTGGFTDVLLNHGARKVYAVDVGHGQLAWKLQQHPDVVSLEKTNARYLTREQVPEPIDCIVCDASFISLKTVLPAPLTLINPDSGWLIALIKPQFEAGKDQVGKKGVVRDSALHEAICADISDWLSAQPGWRMLGVTESPITGPEGNKEFLIGARFREL